MNKRKKFPQKSQKAQKPQRSPARGGSSAAPSGSKNAGPNNSGPKIKAQLYGVHAVTEAWANADRVIHGLYGTEKALDAFDFSVAKGQSRPEARVVDKDVLDKSLPPGAVHQGLALDCAPLPELSAEDLIIKTREAERSVLVMLDQVTDPHNVGAIIRSCAAFGADGVIMQRKHAPDLTGVLAKTACGGVEHVDVAYETNLSRAIETLQQAGYFVYGLDERGEQTPAEIKAGGKSVIVLGAEGSGLRRLVAEHCDALLRLPTQPPIASLNVSNAAAVALYAFLNKF